MTSTDNPIHPEVKQSSSSLRIPVEGYLVPYLPEYLFRQKGTPTAKLSFDEASDAWSMVPQHAKRHSGTSSVICWLSSEPEANTKYIRIDRIGRTGRTVHGDPWS